MCCARHSQHVIIIWINSLHSSNSYFILSVSSFSYPSKQEPLVVSTYMQGNFLNQS